MATSTDISRAINLLAYESQIKNLITGLAYDQDWLDYSLFQSLWTQESIRLDLSGHLPEYGLTHESAASLISKTRLALSGFEGTRHLISNVAVIFNPGHGLTSDPDHAEVIAQLYAYHYLDGEYVIAFASWRVSLARRGLGDGVPAEQQAKIGDMGDWVAEGITVDRDFPLQGTAELYAKARERAERGQARSGRGGLDVKVS